MLRWFPSAQSAIRYQIRTVYSQIAGEEGHHCVHDHTVRERQRRGRSLSNGEYQDIVDPHTGIWRLQAVQKAAYYEVYEVRTHRSDTSLNSPGDPNVIVSPKLPRSPWAQWMAQLARQRGRDAGESVVGG